MKYFKINSVNEFITAMALIELRGGPKTLKIRQKEEGGQIIVELPDSYVSQLSEADIEVLKGC